MFERFWQILKPDGQLLIQCGGHRNLTKTLSIINKVRKSKEFYNYFCNNKGLYLYLEVTINLAKNNIYKKEILQEIGLKNSQFLQIKMLNLVTKKNTFFFIKTIVLIPYLKYLPNETLKDKFAKSVIQEIETNAKELQWKLDFVRLNINAIK